MNTTKNFIALPGTDKQLSLLLNTINVSGLSILVMGSGSERVSEKFGAEAGRSIELIVEDLDSLLIANMLLDKNKNINIKMMVLDSTDYVDNSFDLIYAQASVSSLKRKIIIMEIKRILKNDGYFCVGEITKLKRDVPTFIENVFSSSELDPLFTEDLTEYYRQRGFKIIYQQDLSDTLREYYGYNLIMLNDEKILLREREKKYFKKLLNKISHESNVYLKQGGDRFVGFKTLLLRKENG